MGLGLVLGCLEDLVSSAVSEAMNFAIEAVMARSCLLQSHRQSGGIVHPNCHGQSLGSPIEYSLKELASSELRQLRFA